MSMWRLVLLGAGAAPLAHAAEMHHWTSPNVPKLGKTLWLATQLECHAEGVDHLHDPVRKTAMNILRASDGTIVLAFPGGGQLINLLHSVDNNNHAKLAARGYSNAYSVVQEAFAPVNPAPARCTNCSVGRAWLSDWSSLRSKVINRTREMLAARPAPIMVVGSSMGSPIALLCASELANWGLAPAATYTFGAPRLGNRKYAAYLEMRLPNLYYFSTVGDVFNFLPPVPGFAHAGTASLWHRDSDHGKPHFVICPNASLQDQYEPCMQHRRYDEGSPEVRLGLSAGAGLADKEISFNVNDGVKNVNVRSGSSGAAASKTAPAGQDVAQVAKKTSFISLAMEMLKIDRASMAKHYPGTYLRDIETLPEKKTTCAPKPPASNSWASLEAMKRLHGPCRDPNSDIDKVQCAIDQKLLQGKLEVAAEVKASQSQPSLVSRAQAWLGSAAGR